MIVEGIITISQLYEVIKYWGPIVAFGVAVYKASSWVKEKGQAADDIKTNVSILDSNVKAQTTQIVTELRELRSDIRTFYGPFAAAAAASPKPRQRRKPSAPVAPSGSLLLDN